MTANPPSLRDNSPEPALTLQLLGHAGWRRADGTAGHLIPKDAALLAMLAFDGPVSRLLLFERLWPGKPVDKAAASLRQRLKRLRDATAERVAESDSATVRLLPDVHIDALAIETFDAGQVVAAGELLAGCDFGDHEDLDRWHRRARERVAQRLVARVTALAEAAEQEGALDAALALAEHIVRSTPQVEHAWRRLMRLHYLRQDRGAAIGAFERLEAVLRDELGTRPAKETLQLLQIIEESDAAVVLPRPPLPVSLRRPPRLVGRESAWLAMSRAWRSGTPFLLVAEAGLGKTRLLEAFVRGRQDVVFERGRGGDERSPYALLIRMLVQVNQRKGGTRAEAPLDPSHARTLARLAPELAGPDTAAGEPSAAASVSGHIEHDGPGALWRAIEALLQSAATAGLSAIVLDDVHAADIATLQVLRWLVGSPLLGPIRLGLAARPFEPGPAAGLMQQWLAESTRPERIELTALAPAELADLLASLALPALLAPGVADHMYRHAGGHPLFTLATLQDAIGQGCNIAAGELPSPSSVQALLDERLARLPAKSRDLLAVAAVAGVDLSVDLAGRVLGVAPLDLAEPWAALEAANVLQGERFVHDMVHECALRQVPQGLRQALHRHIAEALQTDEQLAPRRGAAQIAAQIDARIAAHWEAGGRAAQAARGWRRAAMAARATARLTEQAELLERAAACHHAAGEREEEFDARHAILESLAIRHGGRAVVDALPALEALALDGERRLRCSLARAEALIDQEHAGPALAECQRAVESALRWPHWRADAQRLLGMALVQARRADEALTAARQAVAWAEADDDDALRLRAARSLAYVHYARGELAQALPLQRRALSLADAATDHAEAAAAEGSLAALLAVIGDAPGTYHHARGVRARYRDMGLAQSSTLGTVNHILQGNAAAYLGHLGEAEQVLREAVDMADAEAAAAAQAKARLALARLNLTLGQPQAARELLAQVPTEAPVGMRMQVAWAFARAAAMDGLPQQAHWQQLARLGAAHPDLPYVVSAWFEWSYQGPPGPAITRLQRVCDECAAHGLVGATRTHQTRLLARWLDLEGEDATTQTLKLARSLMPHVAQSLTVRCYPPAVWLTLSEAFTRAAEGRLAARCRQRARKWILEQALPSLAEAQRGAFLQTNPINRVLLQETVDANARNEP